MGREYEPTVGQWYEDLENEETFQVLKVDEDKETVEIQHLDGDIEEFDVDGWAELDLELTEEPEGWSGSKAEKDEDDEEEDDEDWDEDEDEMMMTTRIWTTTKRTARNISPRGSLSQSRSPGLKLARSRSRERLRRLPASHAGPVLRPAESPPAARVARG